MTHLIRTAALLMAILAAHVVAAAWDAAWAQGKPAKADAAAAATAAKSRLARLAAVKSWGYQLRLIDPAVVSASPYDLVVVDHGISANHRFVRQYTPDEVAQMKQRPDGSRRILLAYLSIGEAERYRVYWQQAWYEPGKAPSWLGSANAAWDGNWRVRFWEPGWQEIIYAGADTYLSRIKAQGFDGVYLDRADVYHELLAERPAGRADMVRFIASLAAAARRDDPAFMVVLQNAEELLNDRPVRTAIDAIAKEDLLYGAEREGEANPPDMVAGVLANLRPFRREGRPVFVVEYVHEHGKALAARRLADKERFVLHFAERSLGILAMDRPDDPKFQPELRPQALPDR